MFTPIKDNNADKDLSPAHLCMDLQPHSAADGESLPRTIKAYEVTSCCDLDQTVLKDGIADCDESRQMDEQRKLYIIPLVRPQADALHKVESVVTGGRSSGSHLLDFGLPLFSLSVPFPFPFIPSQLSFLVGPLVLVF